MKFYRDIFLPENRFTATISLSSWLIPHWLISQFPACKHEQITKAEAIPMEPALLSSRMVFKCRSTCLVDRLTATASLGY